MVKFFPQKNWQIEKLSIIESEKKEGMLGAQLEELIALSPDINNLICDNFFKFILLSEELIEYARRDFLTKESIRHLTVWMEICLKTTTNATLSVCQQYAKNLQMIHIWCIFTSKK